MFYAIDTLVFQMIIFVAVFLGIQYVAYPTHK